EAHARRPVGLGVDGHQDAEPDRRLALDAPALRVLLRLLEVLEAQADSLDDRPVLAGEDLEHAAALAGVRAAAHGDEVALADARHQTTSGARDTIFMKPFWRSSRATAPKMRVPRGLRSSSTSTIALLSKD